jgi:hypothetical protein
MHKKISTKKLFLPTQLSIAEPSATFAGIHNPQFISNSKQNNIFPLLECASTFSLLHGSLGLNLLQVLQHTAILLAHESKAVKWNVL